MANRVPPDTDSGKLENNDDKFEGVDVNKPWLVRPEGASSSSGALRPFDIEPKGELEGVCTAPYEASISLRTHMGYTGHNKAEMDLPGVRARCDVVVQRPKALEDFWRDTELLSGRPQ